MEELEVPQPESALETSQGEPENVAAEIQPEQLELPEDTAHLQAMLEAIVYITDEPLTLQQITSALAQPIDRVKRILDTLVAEYEKPEHGLSIREVAGGYKMATKAEHHEAVRAFVKKLTPPLKLSLAALETLAVIAYKQPVTAPEIMDIRGVQGAGVLKTLLDRKLIHEGGRKKVIGQPILYKTTKEFLVQFGLKDLTELPTLKEFEELGRLELVEETAEAIEAGEPPAEQAPPVEAVGESTSADETADEASVEEAAAEPAVAEDVAVQDVTVEDVTAEDVAVEEAAMEEAPAEPATAEEAPDDPSESKAENA
jgi:segregation and condensation protein B